ncbi:DUF3289 family protein [Pantoea alhagi]|uniref:DUF3289 family protein n=1 Tax=Pantoea alhagi TaxID=1891675 RepID=UPI00202ADB69|nr:DUF3289 family protein [Pantoea alhagi]
MNDTAAADMRYGDLTADQLQKRYRLTDVSEKVNPYTGVRLTPFNLPQSRFYRPTPLTTREAVRIKPARSCYLMKCVA